MKTPLKAQLKFAKLNYKAAKARSDAAACRKFLEQIADLKGRRKGITKARTLDEIVSDRRRGKVKFNGKKAKHMKWKAPKPPKAEKVIRKKNDRKLAEVRWFKRELSSPDGDVRKHALGRLEEMLSADELADVLTAGPGDEIVRKSGANPAKREPVENVTRLVEQLADRSLPTAERNTIVDKLTKAAGGDVRALDALTSIVTEKVR